MPTLAGLGDAQEWFRRGLVVTLVACPCALVVSTPLTIVAAISTAARAGILVKGGEHLERCASLGAVAFDKTGVATTGRLKVVSFEVMAPFDERRTLEHVVAVEARSEHPLATALIEFAATRGVQAGSVGGHDVHAIPGLGLEGQVGERDFWIGSARFLAQRTTVSPAVEQAIAALYACGLTVVACGSGSDVWAIFGALDRTRDDAVAAARGLRTRGISRLVLLSGDHAAAVRASATLMEVGDVRGECTPGDKAHAIRQLKEGGPTAMVGDGINDVPALAAASLGIAVGPRATDAALEAADIVIVDDDLSRLPWLIDHARRTMAVVRQNVWCAVALKIAFMIAAAGGHATLWMAVFADTGATLLVTINGLRMLHDRSLSDSHAHRQHHHHHVHHQPPVHLHEHAHH